MEGAYRRDKTLLIALETRTHQSAQGEYRSRWRLESYRVSSAFLAFLPFAISARPWRRSNAKQLMDTPERERPADAPPTFPTNSRD
jgi:hypothetical protein